MNAQPEIKIFFSENFIFLQNCPVFYNTYMEIVSEKFLVKYTGCLRNACTTEDHRFFGPKWVDLS